MREYILGILTLLVTLFAFKIFRHMVAYKDIKQLLGLKKIWIAGNLFVIKKLSPLDFIEDQGFPMTLFKYKKSKGLFDQVKAELGEDENEEQEINERLKLAEKMADKAVIRFPENIRAKDLFNVKAKREILNIAWTLYGHILAHNFNHLTKVYEMNQTSVLYFGQMAAKFGCSPDKMVKPRGGLSDVESYMINSFIYNAILKEQNAEIEKQNKQPRKGR